MFNRLDDLRRFVCIAEHLTLNGAAIELGLTQPALTRTIKILEQEFGGALFERHARGLRPTELGTRVLQHAQHILKECQLAQADVIALRKGESGLLRIDAGPIWMNAILPWVITQLRRSYPDLRIALSTVNYEAALGVLKTGKLDISCGGFQHMEGLPSYLVRRPMFTVDLAIHAHQSHPIFDCALIKPEALLDFPWLSFQNDNAYFNIVMEQIQRSTNRSIVPAIHCESLLTAIALVREGNFLAVLPRLPSNALPVEDLREVPTELDPVKFDSGMVFRRSLLANKSFVLLLNLCSQRITDCALPPLSALTSTRT